MTTRFAFLTLAALALAVSVPACSTMHPAGLAAASRLDPLNTPPSQIGFAIGVPQELRLADGDAELHMAFRGVSVAAPVVLEETAVLRLSAMQDGGPVSAAPGEIVYIARIAEEDAQRIAALQSQIRALRAGGAKGQGTLSVSLVDGCFIGMRPASIAVSTWIQTGPSGAFVPLTRRQDLARSIGARTAALLRSQLRRCDSPSSD